MYMATIRNRTPSKRVPNIPIHIFIDRYNSNPQYDIKMNGHDFLQSRIEWLKNPETQDNVNFIIEPDCTINKFIENRLNTRFFDTSEYQQFVLDTDKYLKLGLIIDGNMIIKDLPTITFGGKDFYYYYPYRHGNIVIDHVLLLKTVEPPLLKDCLKPVYNGYNWVCRNFFTINGPIETPGPDVDFTNIYKSKNEGGRRTHRKKQRHSKSKRIRKR